MKISCAVFDLDGTLLTSKNKISNTDLNTLRSLSSEGVKIVIATGRSVLQIKEYVATLGIADPVITCNGGVIIRSAPFSENIGKAVHKHPCTCLLRIGKHELLPRSLRKTVRVIESRLNG